MKSCENCYHKKVCIDSANYKNSKLCKQYISDNRIVELPCRLGGSLYAVLNGYIFRYELTEATITSCGTELLCNDCEFPESVEEFELTDVGKTLFTSWKAATAEVKRQIMEEQK